MILVRKQWLEGFRVGLVGRVVYLRGARFGDWWPLDWNRSGEHREWWGNGSWWVGGEIVVSIWWAGGRIMVSTGNGGEMVLVEDCREIWWWWAMVVEWCWCNNLLPSAHLAHQKLGRWVFLKVQTKAWSPLQKSIVGMWKSILFANKGEEDFPRRQR